MHLIRYINYKVKSKDTLFKIARRHKVSVEFLIESNPQIKDNSLIKQDDIIRIPRSFKRKVFKDSKPRLFRSSTAKMQIYDSDFFGKKIALSFDDGPHPVYTSKISEFLRKYNLKATFFVIGEKVRRYPDIVRKIVNEGHTLGNHTYSHPKLLKLTDEEIKKELARTQEAVDDVLGYHYPLKKFRPIGGHVNQRIIDIADSVGANQTILWNVDSRDWEHPKKDVIIKNVLKQASEGGGVILFHDIHPDALESLPEILENLKEQGYQFVTIDVLLKMKYGR